MPKRKRSYSRKPRVKKYRRRRRYGKFTLLRRLKPVANSSMIRKLPYWDQVTISGGAAGAASAYVFSCNGLYDPDITSTGHQPRGFDQYMAFYDHYVVYQASITAKFYVNGANTNCTFVGISISDSPSAETDPNEYIEAYNTKYRVMGGTVTSGSLTPIVMTRKVNVMKFLGRRASSTDLKGSDSANPTEQAYFHIWTAGANSNTAPGVRVAVKIQYAVKLIERKAPGQS